MVYNHIDQYRSIYLERRIMVMRKQIAILICLVLLVSVLPFQAKADFVSSGYCGDPAVNGGMQVTWRLENGNLLILGTGPMENFEPGTAPWYSLRDSIESMYIGEELKSIGDYAFYNCDTLEFVTMRSPVTSIGEGAFQDCGYLYQLDLPKTINTIENNAFSGVLVNCLCYGGTKAEFNTLINIPDEYWQLHTSCEDINTHWKYTPEFVACTNEFVYQSCSCGYGQYTYAMGYADHDYIDGFCKYCGEEDLSGYGIPRLCGADRFLTATKAADAMKEELGIEMFDTIIIANGKDFADALSGSYLAAIKKAPILLTYKEAQEDFAIMYVNMNLVPGGTVYILGGTSSVSDRFEQDLQSNLQYIHGVSNIKRLAGENRFETNLAVLKEAGISAGEEVLVCTGTDFADCLSAAATGKPILLVYKRMMDSQKAFIPTLNNKFTIIGGENAVNSTIEDYIDDYGTTTRVAGSNRYETSILVAQKYFDSPNGAVLAYARNFPDGLCGGALAASGKMPLILTDSKYYSYAAEYTAKKGIKGGYVLGSESLINHDAMIEILAQ